MPTGKCAKRRKEDYLATGVPRFHMRKVLCFMMMCGVTLENKVRYDVEGRCCEVGERCARIKKQR